jgi:DNA (cytosine-5)-methyltransferase 1
MKKPQLIDFFCGAGGFSEGFRQQGFEVVMGIDNWRPAVDTHNLNHHLADVPRDVIEFAHSTEAIERLPDTEVIAGSPPCFLFSMSNKGGKADKSHGIRLIEAYLRVIVVKKHKRNSKLRAWFLENVPNSRRYIRPRYTFRQLGLTKWARSIKKKPNAVAVEISDNSTILNSADYGAAQKRERFVCGEIVKLGKFVAPEKTWKVHRTLGEVKNALPKPNFPRSKRVYVDPNYPKLRLPAERITDQFYDTGMYEMYWRNAKDYKLNHPYMGRMSFPEDESKPSRTIMATRSSSSRESLIYKSEYNRRGNGEFRTPTIREIACLMGFPIGYQFTGGESTKWHQVGNAVPPFLSAALAKTVRRALGLKPIPSNRVSFAPLLLNYGKVGRLDTYAPKKFDKPPKRKNLSRFRKHPFKVGNMTVALTNYDPSGEMRRGGTRWFSVVFYSTGMDYAVELLEPKQFKRLEKIILKNQGDQGKRFIREFDSHFQEALENVDRMQYAYENPSSSNKAYDPICLIDDIAKFIQRHDRDEPLVYDRRPIAGRTLLPLKQLYAMYAINKLISQQTA